MARSTATEGLLQLPPQRENGSRWHAVDWEKVMAGRGVADKLFLRSGLIRKDLLPKHSGRTTPATWHAPTFVALEALITDGRFALPGGVQREEDQEQEQQQ